MAQDRSTDNSETGPRPELDEIRPDDSGTTTPDSHDEVGLQNESEDGIPAVANDTKEHELRLDPRSVGLGLGILSKLISWSWWLDASSFVWTFRRVSRKPVALFTGGILLYLTGFLGMFLTLNSLQDQINGNEALVKILGAALIFLLCGLGAVVLVVWSIGLWLGVLTAFSRAYLLQDRHYGRNEELAELQAECLDHFKHRKAFLVVVWLVYSVIAIIPMLLATVASSIVYVGMPVPAGLGISVPDNVMLLAVVATTVLSIAISNYTLMVFPLSSIAKGSGRSVAIDALRWSVRVCPSLSIISLATLTIGGAINNLFLLPFLVPSILFSWSNAWVIALGVWGLLWVGLSQLIVLPFSMVLPCEIVRESMEPKER